MAEKPESSTTQLIAIDSEDDGVGDEEFYEKIEAPKFVDFTARDSFRPDDKYWFCLRVGCDQKHEEEMNHEAISKDFVLRVMAARSPYFRLQKVLNRKASSVIEQCPLSAPAKPSKSRLAVISSVSGNIVDPKGKVKPLSKLSSTPKATGRPVAAKYLTTPRNKNCLPNPNSFRSVQNPKPSSVAVPKSRIVAKALVFHSPKKGIHVKTSAELRTPLTKICEGMKRLEITSQRKRVLGYSNKSGKEIRPEPNKTLSVTPSRRQPSACKGRSNAKELFRPSNCREKEAKSSRRTKRESKGNSNKRRNSIMPKEMVEIDSSSMETDTKSKDGSVLGNSRKAEGNAFEERLTADKTSGSEEASPFLEIIKTSVQNSGAVLLYASGGETSSSFQRQEGNESSEGIDQAVEKGNSSSEKREIPENHDTESQTFGGMDSVDSDDKENALGNRNFDPNNSSSHSGRKVLGKQETCEITKKIARTQDKTLKEGITVAVIGAQGVKYKKPKPTNPKPFRLRTDERRILKEANLERRMQSLPPQKETATVLHKRHGNDMQRNEKCPERSTCNHHDIHVGGAKELKIFFQKDETKQSSLSTSEGQVQQKIATMTPQRRSNSTKPKPKSTASRLECHRDVVSPILESSLRKIKSPSQGQFNQPKGKRAASMRKAVASHLTCQLNVIAEGSSPPSRPEDAGETGHGDTSKKTCVRAHTSCAWKLA